MKVTTINIKHTRKNMGKNYGFRKIAAICLFVTSNLLTVHAKSTALETSISQDAVVAIATGDFERATDLVAQLDNDTTTPLAITVSALIEKYTLIRKELHTKYEEAYDEAFVDFKKALDKAKLYEELNTAYIKYDIDDKTILKEQKKNDKNIDTQWLTSLGNLASLKSIAERLGLPNDIDKTLSTLVTTQAVEDAQTFEDDQKWMQAQRRIGLLATMDAESNLLDDQAEDLLRLAILESFYIDDPNSPEKNWRTMRADVSIEVIEQGFNKIQNDYVANPDQKKMLLSAIEHIYFLSRIDKLSETFPRLEDEKPRALYQKDLAALTAEVLQLSSEAVTTSVMSNYLVKILRINDTTLGFPKEVILSEYSEGACAVLDQYSHFVWPSNVKSFQKELTKEFSGVGILIQMDKGRLTVGSLLEGSPAGKAGLDAADIIIAVDNESIADEDGKCKISMSAAVDRIVGERGTEVVLSVMRDDNTDPIDFIVIRDKIAPAGVEGLCRDENGHWQYFLDEKSTMAYIALDSFVGNTAQELFTLLNQLNIQGMKGLVLDLRNNGGGYLNAAIAIVDMFINNGAIVSRKSPRYPYSTPTMAQARNDVIVDIDMPIIVMVNGSSASASEIVSGALKDHNRALIVGSQTFGKGSVQTVQQLIPTRAQMKITGEYYYLPSGRCVHRDPKDKLNKDFGVLPNVDVQLTMDQMIKLLKTQRDGAVLRAKRERPTEPKVYSAQDILDVDPQLFIAKLCMQAKIEVHVRHLVTGPNFVKK